MKKILIMFLSIIIVCLSGCAINQKNKNNNNPSSQNESTSPETRGENGNPSVDSESDNSFVDSESDNSFVDSESDNPSVDSESDNSFVDSESDNPSVDSESDNSFVDSESDNSSVTSESNNPSIDSENDNPSVISGSDGQSAVNQNENQSTTENEKNTQSQEKYTYERVLVEKQEIIPVGNTANLMQPLSGGFDKEAEKLRQEILKTKDDLNITGNRYYVSPSGDDSNDGLSEKTPWKSFDGISMNSYLFEPGDAVLFERGGVYRQSSTFYVKSGLTLGAYGKGEKPQIYGSQMNYSQPELWEPSSKKFVWKIQLTTLDAGSIIFNHGEAIGSKKDGLLELEKNGDFYHNVDESIFYLYLDKGYPDVIYDDIEIAQKGNMLFVPAKAKNVTIDNLCLKYGGSHAIGTTNQTQNMRITNCEIGWIGGSYQDPEENPDVRYGNGIQFWDTTIDSVVENNWVYQCYDTGITFQGNGPNSTYKNLVFKNNLIEYCTYNFEFWDGATEGNIKENIVIEKNISRFAGYGWGPDERPENSYTSHIFFGATTSTGISNFVIQNNIFDRHAYFFAYCSAESNIYEIYTIKNNKYYQKSNSLNRVLSFGGKYSSANSKAEFESAIRVFDSSPNSIVFES